MLCNFMGSLHAVLAETTHTQTLSEKSKMASIWINHKIEIFFAQDYDCVLLTSNAISNHTISRSILRLIQIDAILDFSESVWVWVVSANTACKLPLK